jgi:hypothetical protein
VGFKFRYGTHIDKKISTWCTVSPNERNPAKWLQNDKIYPMGFSLGSKLGKAPIGVKNIWIFTKWVFVGDFHRTLKLIKFLDKVRPQGNGFMIQMLMYQQLRL